MIGRINLCGCSISVGCLLFGWLRLRFLRSAERAFSALAYRKRFEVIGEVVILLFSYLAGSNDYPRPDDSTNKQLNNQQTFFRLFAKNTK